VWAKTTCTQVIWYSLTWKTSQHKILDYKPKRSTGENRRVRWILHEYDSDTNENSNIKVSKENYKSKNTSVQESQLHGESPKFGSMRYNASTYLQNAGPERFQGIQEDVMQQYIAAMLAYQEQELEMPLTL
jgi:hypothetical protein